MKENPLAMLHASAKLNEYLVEFPEHDQGDIRVWEAKQILDAALVHPKGHLEIAVKLEAILREIEAIERLDLHSMAPGLRMRMAEWMYAERYGRQVRQGE
jgi:hypothetical protein